jgi:hypothetical protein
VLIVRERVVDDVDLGISEQFGIRAVGFRDTEVAGDGLRVAQRS